MKILGGTFVAQLILILSIPLVTRLYSPENFGDFAVFMGVLGGLGVVASYRYELVIAGIRKDIYASVTLKVVIVLCSLNAILITIFLLFLMFTEFVYIDLFFILLPISFLINGLFQALIITSLRESKINIVSIIKIIQSVILISSQIILDEFGSFGLCLAQLISVSVGLIITLYVCRDAITRNKKITRKKFFYVLKKNIECLKFSSPAAFLNAAGMHMPVLLLSYFFSPLYAGLYAVATRILLTPANLVTNAISKVLLSEAKEFHDKYYINTIFKKNIKLQLSLIIPPLIVVCFINEEFFSYLLGEQWLGISSLVKYFAPWVLLSFLSNPCLIVLETTGKQKVILFFQACMLIVRFLSIYIGYVYDSGELALQLFSYVSGFSWLVLFLFFSRYYDLNMWIHVFVSFVILLLFSMTKVTLDNYVLLIFLPYPFLIYYTYKRVTNV